MADSSESGICLIVDFDWPKPFKPEYGLFAGEPHSAVQNQDCITEVLSASGGLGSGWSSIWVF